MISHLLIDEYVSFGHHIDYAYMKDVRNVVVDRIDAVIWNVNVENVEYIFEWSRLLTIK